MWSMSNQGRRHDTPANPEAPLVHTMILLRLVTCGGHGYKLTGQLSDPEPVQIAMMAHPRQIAWLAGQFGRRTLAIHIP